GRGSRCGPDRRGVARSAPGPCTGGRCRTAGHHVRAGRRLRAHGCCAADRV
ncbi:MAG: hypothetical protein AVDCRST_MAG48-604, partial [uncultured Friedmanniella sp.]